MKLVRLSIFAAIYANAENNEQIEEVPEDTEVVTDDRTWMDLDSEDSSGEEPLMRNFLYRGRFIMEDYICRSSDAPEWCGGPIGESFKDNRREFQNLVNYGCNCWPENKKAPGHPETGHWTDHLWWQPGTNGKPLDNVDAACQEMSARYRCVKHDLGACDYQVTYDYSWSPSAEKVYCNRGSQCQKRICQIDKMFARKLKVLLNGRRPSEFVNENPSFKAAWETDGMCNAYAAPIENLDCCGPTWKRFPYDVDSEKCCDKEIYALNDADASC